MWKTRRIRLGLRISWSNCWEIEREMGGRVMRVKGVRRDGGLQTECGGVEVRVILLYSEKHKIL